MSTKPVNQHASNAEKLRILPGKKNAPAPRIAPRFGPSSLDRQRLDEPTAKAGREIYSRRASARIDAIPEAWQLLAERFKKHLEAANRSPGTVDSYLEAIQRVTLFMVAQGMPSAWDPELANGEYVGQYFVDLIRQGASPNTARLRFASLRVFFKWCEKVGEIRPNPMVHLDSPRPVEVVKPVYALEDIQQMLDHCGDDFVGRRDKAIILVWR